MPFPMKVQPVDSKLALTAAKPAAMSRLKRLLERQFQSVMRISTAEKLAGAGDCRDKDRDDTGDLEPSSLCLDKMVISFMEEGNNFEKPPPAAPPRSRCNCFNGNSSDDNFADAPTLSVSPSGDAAETIKSLVLCTSITESNLLTDALKIAEKAKNSKDKDGRLKVIAGGLCALGYDSSLCKSKWETTPYTAAGEHSYIDVIVENGRLILDVDFKSEFEIARSTKSYRAVLQQLPVVFVGTGERLQQIVAIVAEAARQSLKKKGLHVPPWRKCEYMKAKWLSSYQRTTALDAAAALEESVGVEVETSNGEKGGDNDDNVMNFTMVTATFSGNVDKLGGSCKDGDDVVGSFKDDESEEKNSALPWAPPPAKPKSGVKVVTGLASVL